MRGNGKSGGGFYFGGKEYLDLEPALKWAESQYPKTFLMGFSLGAYHSLRAVTQFENQVQHLFLVSCPTLVDEIFWEGHFFRNLGHQLFGNPSYQKDRSVRDFLFQWRNPFCKKPSTLELAPKLRVPVSFLVGEWDYLIPESMSDRVFQTIPHHLRKSWVQIPRGGHAEDLFLFDRDRTMGWFRAPL